MRAFQLQLAEDYSEVAEAVWGVRDTATSRGPSTSMDERRWRLFTRLVDASTPGEARARAEG